MSKKKRLILDIIVKAQFLKGFSQIQRCQVFSFKSALQISKLLSLQNLKKILNIQQRILISLN